MNKPVDTSLGIWLVRAEAEPVGALLQAHLGGILYRPWLTNVTNVTNIPSVDSVDGPPASQKAQFAGLVPIV